MITHTETAITPEPPGRIGTAISPEDALSYLEALGVWRDQRRAELDLLDQAALAAPDTIDTIPEKTLRAFAEHGRIDRVMASDGDDAESTLKRFAQAGIDIDALAIQLQRDGAASFVKSWQELMQRIADKSAALAGAGKGA